MLIGVDRTENERADDAGSKRRRCKPSKSTLTAESVGRIRYGLFLDIVATWNYKVFLSVNVADATQTFRWLTLAKSGACPLSVGVKLRSLSAPFPLLDLDITMATDTRKNVA